MGNTRDILLDDGPIVEHFGDVMAGCADQLYSTLKSLMIGFASDKCGQERVMNVNDAVRIFAHELRRKNLHVACENDEVHRLPLEQCENLALSSLFCVLLYRNQIKGNAIELRNRLAIRMIRNNARNVARQFSALMPVKQIH